ncbi:MAG: phosphoserine phosphatase SerB, partial [Pseudomonadales bacterium]|nr:phosphoserine phosphatase SerB [Pseudomonadales bacterium]
MGEIYLINVLGADRTGLTSDLMHILAGFEVQILDIGQAVIHDQLTLGMLVEIPGFVDSSPLLKDVLFLCHAQG